MDEIIHKKEAVPSKETKPQPVAAKAVNPPKKQRVKSEEDDLGNMFMNELMTRVNEEPKVEAATQEEPKVETVP